MASRLRDLIRVLDVLHKLALVIWACTIFVSVITFLATLVYLTGPYFWRVFIDPLLTQIIGFNPVAEIQPISVLARTLISAIFGLLLSLAVFSVRRWLIYRRRVRHVSEAFRVCLNGHLAFMNDINRIGSSRGKDKQVRLAERFRDHGVYLCGRISEIFETLTQAKCHTTVKSFDPNTGVIRTRARDVLMHNRDRSQADEGSTRFMIEDHTAFSNIVDKANKYMFISNHLYLRYLFSIYTNKNLLWRRFYSATVVVPITQKRRPSEINRQSVIGFVTVDSKRGYFTKRTSRLVLSLFSELVYHTMVHLGWKDDQQ
jgi:ABC-type multidrug transport system fused ATPase/permease subunit